MLTPYQLSDSSQGHEWELPRLCNAEGALEALHHDLVVLRGTCREAEVGSMLLQGLVNNNMRPSMSRCQWTARLPQQSRQQAGGTCASSAQLAWLGASALHWSGYGQGTMILQGSEASRTMQCPCTSPRLLPSAEGHRNR